MRRRDYGGPDDLVAMQRAVRRDWTPERRWHVGDLAWQWHSAPDPDARTALWQAADGAVRAWGRVSPPGHLDWHAATGEPVGPVLAWFDEIAAGAEQTVTVMDTDRAAAAALAEHGYRPVAEPAPFFRHHVRDLGGDLPEPRLPTGYRVRAVRPGEIEERAAVHRAAWRPARIGRLLVPPRDLGDGASRVSTDVYRAVAAAWPYRPDLDQVVEAPDGTLAAFALGWLDEVNRVGELEPVGTDPAHARRGLGTAVSVACLRAMRKAGATRAVVHPRGDVAYPVPEALYRSLGFRPVARTVTWTRTAGPGTRPAPR